MRLLLATLSLCVAVGCDEPGATLRLVDVRASRTPENRVAVDVELVADEGLGGNIGVYCTRVTFEAQAVPAELCSTDMEDGDIKTVRLVSETDLGAVPNPSISVRVRHARVDLGRSIVAPGRIP
jgi:hypothetical protein